MKDKLKDFKFSMEYKNIKGDMSFILKMHNTVITLKSSKMDIIMELLKVNIEELCEIYGVKFEDLVKIMHKGIKKALQDNQKQAGIKKI